MLPFFLSVTDISVLRFSNFLLLSNDVYTFINFFFFRYMKFLYAYECHKLGLSTRNELETAIEGNKREGRRTSYYGDLQMRSPTSNSANNGPHSNNSMHHHGSSRISPVSLVTTSTSNSVNNRIQVNGHSSQFPNHVGDAQIPNVSGLVIPGMILWYLCFIHELHDYG